LHKSGGVHTDLQSLDLWVNRVDARIAFGRNVAPARHIRTAMNRLCSWETLPICSVELGLPMVMDHSTRSLKTAGLAQGKRCSRLMCSQVIGCLARLSRWIRVRLAYMADCPELRDADYLWCRYALARGAPNLKRLRNAAMHRDGNCRTGNSYIL
jgi:hypothetical protein